MLAYTPNFAPIFESSLDFLTTNETQFAYKLPGVVTILPDDEYEILIKGSKYAEIVDGSILFDLEGLEEGAHSFEIILKNLEGPEKKYFLTLSY